MANQKAAHLIALGFHPVLLGLAGAELKRPQLCRWQTTVYTPWDTRVWPAGNNIGIRCGQQRNGLSLLVFDFDEEADRIFPFWLHLANQIVQQTLVVVSSGRGYHVYFYTQQIQTGCTLAGKYGESAAGRHQRKQLYKFIETLGEGRQVVSAGSRHPSGQRYFFLSPATYSAIPRLTEEQYQALVSLSRQFDQRPKRLPRHGFDKKIRLTGSLRDVDNCLTYARRYIGVPEREERNGDVRFLGLGGLLVTANGRGWYAFADETGGGLAELIAWHQALLGEGQ